MLGEGLFPPRQARSHGPDGDTEHLGNFGIVEVGDVAQHEGDPKVVGDLRESRGNRTRLVEMVGKIGCRVRIGVWCLGGGEHNWVGGAWGASNTPNFVNRGVGGDAVDPGRQARPSVEAGEPANDRKKGVLYRIVGAFPRENHAMAYGMNRVVVQSQQSIDGFTLAGAGTNEQVGLVAPELCGVDGPGVHVRRLVVAWFGAPRGWLRPR